MARGMNETLRGLNCRSIQNGHTQSLLMLSACRLYSPRSCISTPAGISSLGTVTSDGLLMRRSASTNSGPPSIL